MEKDPATGKVLCFFCPYQGNCLGGQTTVNLAEYLAHLPPEERQDTNNNNCDKHQNERVFNETLTLFLRKETS